MGISRGPAAGFHFLGFLRFRGERKGHATRKVGQDHGEGWGRGGNLFWES